MENIAANQLQQYPCPVCGSTTNRPVHTIRQFPIVQCVPCTMVFVNPRLKTEFVYNIYKDHYFNRPSDGYDNYTLTAHLRIKTFEKWYVQIKKFCASAKGQALDIGCAAGYFLDILKKDHWQTEGIELDTTMHADLLNRSYQAFNQPIETFTPTHSYDLITLFDVIEHLPNLQADIKKLHDMLNPGGMVALVTPNVTSTQRKLFGKRWFQFKPLEHIYYFSPATMRLLAEKNGFSVTTIQPCGQFADISFLQNRLHKYGFKTIARLFGAITTMLGIRHTSWYADTGSMFVILQKQQP